MKYCSWCSDEFLPAVTYQIYCSSECRELSTKEKIAKKYQISRRKKKNKNKKKCSGGCETIISIYNETGFCSVCMTNKKKVEKLLKEIKGYIEYEQN
jgi:hypothetical protein